MSSTSQKHKDFVAEPMGEKPVMALAGIGEVLGKRLEEKGFDKVFFSLFTPEALCWLMYSQYRVPAGFLWLLHNHLQGLGAALFLGLSRTDWKSFSVCSPPQAYVVLGQFLVLKKDEELFRDWLKDTCGANAKQQGDCYGCLKEWCDAFL